VHLRCAAFVLAFSLFLCCSPAAAAGEKRALLIGINDYFANDAGPAATAGQSWIPADLNGAVNDIALMQQILESRFNFPRENIQTLTDRDATRAAVLAALEKFVAETEADDTVYIHFSGHGSQVKDLDGDEPDGLDETILPFDARTGDIPDITDDELQRLLRGLPARSSLVVLDSCHSGTATRGSSVMRARSVPMDPRGDLYASAKTPEHGVTESPARYVLMTGAADYQSALDGPIDEGRYYGLFTWSLGKSLGRVPPGASAREIHAGAREEMQRIGAGFGLYSVPEAQLEAPAAQLEQGILSEAPRDLESREVARLPWVTVSPAAGDEVRLANAASLGAAPASLWAVYPPGEMEFAPGRALATVTVARVQGDDAFGTLDIPAQRTAPGSRAVQLATPPVDDRVPVLLERMTADARDSLTAALGSTPGSDTLRIVGEGEFARFVVDAASGEFVVYGAGGLQVVEKMPASDAAAAARRLVTLARRSQTVTELLSLDNPSSRLGVSVTVNPTDDFGGVRGVAVVGAAEAPAYRVRRQGEPRSPANSLVLEIEVTDDSYLTVVDIDPDGAVGILFPNPISEKRGFLPDGFVRGGSSVRIPDGLDAPRAGFHWDYVPPAGIDTLRVFAAGDEVTARKIRAYVRQLASTLNQRGAGSGIIQRRDLFVSPGDGVSTRGVATVAAEPEASAPDWTASTVTVVIEE
jgi:hypothetical protein